MMAGSLLRNSVAVLALSALRPRAPAGTVVSHVPRSVPRDAARRARDRRQAEPQKSHEEQTSSPPPHRRGFSVIVMAVVKRISRDNLTLVAAGVAFYCMLAIFPAIAALISIYGLFADPQSVQGQLNQVGGLLPPEVMKLITDATAAFASKGATQLNMAALIGFVLALWSAKSGMSALMTGLNIANETEEKRSYVMQLVTAIALTLFGIVLAILALAAIAGVPAVSKIVGLEGVTKYLVEWGRWPLLAIVVELAFSVIYRYGPYKEHPKWRWISIGAAVATLLWLVGSGLFSYYVSNFGGYDKTYGSLAAVVILLLWLWMSALVVLVGAEIDAELSATDGKGARPLPKKGTQPVAHAEQ